MDNKTSLIPATELPSSILEQPVKELPIADPNRDIYVGISAMPFAVDSAQVLMSPIAETDVEIRPDGIVYLPEIKYRRRLNLAFGPGGWAIMPRGPFSMQDNTMTREYAMYVSGRFVSQAVGEQEYIPNNPNMTYATASEGVRSNAIMRCCKDIGIASELWDPIFIAQWKGQYALQVWVKGKGKPQWRRKDREPFFGETGPVKNQAAPVSGEQSAAQAAETPTNAADDGNQEPPVDNSDMKSVVVKIISVSEKPTSTGGTRYGIKTDWPDVGERWLNTFSHTLGKVAKEVKGTTQKVLYKVSQWKGQDQYDLEGFER